MFSLPLFLVGLALIGLGIIIGHVWLGNYHYMNGMTAGVITSNKILKLLIKRGILVVNEDKASEYPNIMRVEVGDDAESSADDPIHRDT